MPVREPDPTDVFPRRNLPPSAEPWGRTVEGRLVNVEDYGQALAQNLQGLNRSTASQFASLTDQMNRILTSVRVIGSSQALNNTGATEPIIPGGSMMLFKPDWATHALVEFTTVTLTSPGDLSGEVAVVVQVADVENPTNAQISVVSLVDSSSAAPTYSVPLAIEVPSGALEYSGYVEPTIAGSGTAYVQIFSKVTWIARGVQTTGDIE